MVGKINNFFINADRVCDYIPVVSTITNLVDLFQKAVFHLVDRFKNPSQDSSLGNKYFTHIKSKNYSRCVALAVCPIFGNLLFAMHDRSKKVALKKITLQINNAEKDEKFFWYEGSNLEFLPKEIGNLSQLKNLDLKDNRLTSIPKEIGNLAQLKRLHLARNKLTTLPAEIGNLVQLEDLDLQRNKLTTLPAEIGNLSQLEHLFFGGNKLSSPPAEIGNLAQLKILDLQRNELTTLPAEIGNLAQLKILDLKDNRLTSIPKEIESLALLKSLYLQRNKLSSLPAEIGNLAQLKSLDLEDNHLTALPAEIGNLVQLRYLYLGGNQLTSLPVSMGSLTNLKELDLRGNPNLAELPLSLGQIRELIEIDIRRTGISVESRDAILRQCQALRAEEALQVISSRLKSWGLKSKMEFNFSQELEFDEDEKIKINEWLVRLENTKDFNSQFQTTLAQAVCAMLIDAAQNEDFKVSFFNQIASNLECCQDRAAMALNEIFTSWKLSQLDDSIPLKDRLQTMASGAKTLALRAAIARHIDQYQRKNGAIEGEAVEIYLYYETALKDELNLLSIIENMAYGQIGQRDWIRKDELIKEVNDSYLDHLVELDSFKKIVEADSEYNATAEEKLEPIENKLLELSMTPPEGVDKLSEEYLNWQSEVNELDAKRKQIEADLKKEWVKKKL